MLMAEDFIDLLLLVLEAPSMLGPKVVYIGLDPGRLDIFGSRTQGPCPVLFFDRQSLYTFGF